MNWECDRFSPHCKRRVSSTLAFSCSFSFGKYLNIERPIGTDAELAMAEAYTVSKMLASINESMAPVATDTCASVSLKRRMDNGVMLDTSAKEIAYLDMKSKIKHSAARVATLARSDKLEWINGQRARANAAFGRQEFQQAAEIYIQTLTGLDFGETAQEKRDMEQNVQIPLTCNLAACMLMLEVLPAACIAVKR